MTRMWPYAWALHDVPWILFHRHIATCRILPYQHELIVHWSMPLDYIPNTVAKTGPLSYRENFLRIYLHQYKLAFSKKIFKYTSQRYRWYTSNVIVHYNTICFDSEKWKFRINPRYGKVYWKKIFFFPTN